MRFFLIPALIALLTCVPTAFADDSKDEALTDQPNMQPPAPDGPVRRSKGPRHTWTPERWLDEAYYLEGEHELAGAVDALWTALRLGGGGQRHAYDLGRLLLELLRGHEAREAFCLARLGPDESWRELAEERLAGMGEKAPHWCSEGDDWDPFDWRRNIPTTYQKWDGKLRDSPCGRAMDRAWKKKNAEHYVEAIALFGEAEKVCPNKQLIELEVAYCLLFLERPDAAGVSLFEVTLGPDDRLSRQASRQLSVMPKPSQEERERREAEVARRLKADEEAARKAEKKKKKSEGEAGGSN